MRARKRKMAMINLLVALFYVQQAAATEAKPCKWQQLEHFNSKKNPIYLNYPEKDVLQPECSSGNKFNFSIPDQKLIIVACPGNEYVNMCDRNYNLISQSERFCNSFVATCKNGQMLPHIVNPDNLQLGDMQCCDDINFDSPPKSSIHSNKICESPDRYKRMKVINYGFNVVLTSHSTRVHGIQPFRFVELLSCYDESLKSAVYSMHYFRKFPSLGKIGFSSIDRPKFKSVNQKKDLEYLESLYKYGNENMELNKGHLTPNADFAIQCLRNETFFFQNAAPQLKKRNSDWAEVEEKIRNKYKKALIITGTSTVQGETAKYLGQEQNFSPKKLDRVLIPDLFWKIVIDDHERTLFIFPNVPVADQDEVMETFNEIFETESVPKYGYSTSNAREIKACREVIPEMDMVLREISQWERPEEFWQRIAEVNGNGLTLKRGRKLKYP